MPFPSLSEHGVLLLFTELLVVVAVARLLGLGMRRIGQPPIIGELLAGLLLGPSILGKLAPATESWLFPSSAVAGAPLNAVGWLGVAFLLVLTGFETDLKLIRSLGRAAVYVAICGLLIPFIAGLALGILMPASFEGKTGNHTAFVAFIAVALTISSLPVIAKVLDELGLMRRNFGQITVGVGMANDLVGWMALGIIAALGRAGTVKPLDLAIALLGVGGALLVAFTVGQKVVDMLLRAVRQHGDSTFDGIAVTLLVTFAFAAALQGVRSDAALGAYIAGIVLGRSRFFSAAVGEHLRSITMAVLAPVFFATAGLRIDLSTITKPSALVWAAIILVLAVASKVVGALLGARLARLERRESLALAVCLNARGAVEVVIATVGLSLGVLGVAAYTAIVLMAILTSVMAPPLLRLITRDWLGSGEEQERLQQEETLGRNLVVRPGRLLLPSQGGPSSMLAASVLNHVWPRDVPVSIVSVGERGDEPDVSGVMRVLEGRDVEHRRVNGSDIRSALVAEARLGYGAIATGACAGCTDDAVFSDLIDGVLADSPVPVVVVRPGTNVPDPSRLPAFRRVLVPVAGTPESRTGQEIALHLSKTAGTETVLMHVNRPNGSQSGRTPARAGRRAQATDGRVASGVLEQAVGLAEELKVPARTSVRSGVSDAEEIMAEASSADADLIVTGTTVRQLEGGHPFLGHTVEQLLADCDVTIIVVSTPSDLAAKGLSGRHL